MAVLKARIQFKKNSSWAKSESDALVIIAGKSSGKNSALIVPGKTPDSLLESLQNSKTFKGKLAQIENLGGPGTKISELTDGVRLLAVGFGERSNLHAQVLLAMGGRIAQELRRLKVSTATIVIDAILDSIKSDPNSTAKDFAGRPLNSGITGADSVIRYLFEGIQLGLYSYDVYKSSAREDSAAALEVDLVSEKVGSNAKIEEALNTAEICSEAVYLTRDFQTIPGGDLRPSQLAKRSTDLAKELNIKSTLLDSKKLASEGLNGIIAVGQGSDDPPYLIVLESYSKDPKAPTICLIGKGVTFDTGGISIKPAPGMEDMKYDMSGAASVLGAVYGLVKLKAPVNVIGIIPTAENMPSGNATRPGDIYTAFGGKTVEVLNTDAEGRLILADALGYAKRFAPDAVVDVATLTGAVIIALGGVASAVMGNDGNLIQGFADVSNAIGEKVWELPLYAEYGEDMKSKIADIKNIGGKRDAGSQKGGAFLNFFVDDAYPWIHVDIAGSAMQPQDQGAHCPAGVGSGVPTRSLIELGRNLKKAFPKALMTPKAQPAAEKTTSKKVATAKATAKKATSKRA